MKISHALIWIDTQLNPDHYDDALLDQAARRAEVIEEDISMTDTLLVKVLVENLENIPEIIEAVQSIYNTTLSVGG